MHTYIHILENRVHTNTSNSIIVPEDFFWPSPVLYLYVPSSTVRTVALSNINPFTHFQSTFFFNLSYMPPNTENSLTTTVKNGKL